MLIIKIIIILIIAKFIIRKSAFSCPNAFFFLCVGTPSIVARCLGQNQSKFVFFQYVGCMPKIIVQGRMMSRYNTRLQHGYNVLTSKLIISYDEGGVLNES